MKRKLASLIFLFAFGCAGCQTMLENRMMDNAVQHFISVGMPEAKVREILGVPQELVLLPDGTKKFSYLLTISNVTRGLTGKVTDTKKRNIRMDVFIGASGVVDRYEKAPSEEFAAASELFRKANDANTHGDFKTGLALLNQLIDSNPNRNLAREIRASLYERLGNRAAAAEDYQFILKNDPDNTLALHNLGVFYYEQGDLDASVREFDGALRGQPNHVISRAYRARTFAKQGRLDEARADIEAALQNGFVFDKKLKEELSALGVQVE